MRKALTTAIVVTSIGLLGACGANDNNLTDRDNGTNFSPVRYDDERNDTRGVLDDNQNGDFFGNDRNDFAPNRIDDNFDLDTGNRNVRQPGEPDTLFNMDREEPDPDEEPREQLGRNPERNR
ncbi:hypothetical protein ACFSCX_25450 [Bacillus salitolerans]|uniref:Lipoprotein n=1 Tax=Bacillus salitolerans TaxID=1437434 RepID=A0ABW4LX89_9BACI